jgi:hypothetical protein
MMHCQVRSRWQCRTSVSLKASPLARKRLICRVLCPATTVVSQLGPPTGAVGFYRYGHGSRFTREDMASDVRGDSQDGGPARGRLHPT